MLWKPQGKGVEPQLLWMGDGHSSKGLGQIKLCDQSSQSKARSHSLGRAGFLSHMYTHTHMRIFQGRSKLLVHTWLQLPVAQLTHMLQYICPACPQSLGWG